MFKTIAKNVFSNYVGIAGSIIIAFLLSPFLVHTLGDTKFGIWSIVSAFTGYMALLDLGVSSAVAKFVARFKALNNYKSVNTVIASALTIMLVVGTALVLLSPLLASSVVHLAGFEGSLADTVHTLILVGSLDMCIFVVTGVLVGSMYGFQHFQAINAINITMSLLRALLFYLALTNGYDLVAMALLSVLGKLLACIFTFLALRRAEPNVQIDLTKTEKSTVMSIFHFSRFTFLSMVAMQLVYYSDAFVIGYFMSAAAITYYTIPWSLSEYTNRLILAIAHTFTPVFSAQDATVGNQTIYQTYIIGTKFMLFISNLLCGGVLVLGYYFLAIWMGPTYAEKCTTVLTIMFYTQLVKGPQLLSYGILLATSKHRVYSFYNIGFSLMNLILSIVLIQQYGLVGVAIGTAITQMLFYGVITPFLTSRVLGSSLWSYFLNTYIRSVPSSIVLILLLSFLSNRHAPDGYVSLLGQALVSACVYAGVAYFTLLNTKERNFLLNAGKRLVARYKSV
ncbi:oligosaccharide flippase family protein [Granulosicoccus sp.]|nr:oligosaccharide flippase family protein [Granulosicoccus sp.]MDB4224681.1 oligosaccharide flippase family protein [Granulosicoccus sp.]